MFDLTFLKTSERQQTERLKKERSVCVNVERLTAIDSELREIESHRKPLSECTIDECMELKQFVYNKFSKLMSIRKGAIGMQFGMILKQIDEVVMWKQIELMKEEAKAKELAKVEEESHADKSRPLVKTNAVRSRWTTRLGRSDSGD